MISDQIIAVSEFRKNPTKVINEVSKWKSKYIFIHNKPKAVLVDVEWFEKMSQEYEIPTEDDIKAFNKSSHWENWVEAFEFLESLMEK